MEFNYAFLLHSGRFFMTESEKTTRKKRIDRRLKSSLLNWKIIPFNKVTDISLLTAHAVKEYPTETGPADYALFVKGKLLGIIEAAGEDLGRKKETGKIGIDDYSWGYLKTFFNVF